MDTTNVEFFNTESIRLSMRSPETGRYLKANVYTLTGVENADGSLREMSIGQLVMAVCLNRATTLENEIVDLMDDMAINTDNLDALSQIEELLVSGTNNTYTWTDDTGYKGVTLTEKVTFYVQDATTGKVTQTITTSEINDILDALGINYGKQTSGSEIGRGDGSKTVGDIITALEEKIDAYNTVSQEQLIEMQSLTSKRDDTYSLVSNVLKSLYTVLTGNSNNL